MSSTPEANPRGLTESPSGRDRLRTTPPNPPDDRRAGTGSVDSPKAGSVGQFETEFGRPAAGRRRRGRRGQDRPEGSGQAPSRPMNPAGESSDTHQATIPAERAGNPGRPAIDPGRPEPMPPRTQVASVETRQRRTEGTRPPNPGNGRGLSGSPRNPNHFGEIPIRPDNSTFDATHDRLVCIARSHIIPEDFPVHYRRMTASSRLGVVATSGSDLLLCDRSHSGPHIWPDQTVVNEADQTQQTAPDEQAGQTMSEQPAHQR